MSTSMPLQEKLKAARAEMREAALLLREASSQRNDGPKTLMEHVRDVVAELADLHGESARRLEHLEAYKLAAELAQANLEGALSEVERLRTIVAALGGEDGERE
jgi:hypothetical protein